MTLENIRAMSADDLTRFTGVEERVDEHNGYFWLRLTVEGQDDIPITREYADDEFEEADTPAFYDAWDRRWPDMLRELAETLAQREHR